MIDAAPPQKTTQDVLRENLKPEVVQEQRLSAQELEELTKKKESLFSLSGSIDVSGGVDPSNVSNGFKYDIQNDNYIKIGKLSENELIGLGIWSESGVFGNFFNEDHLYLAPGFFIHPAGEMDISLGDKTVFRGGLSTKWLKPVEGVEVKIEAYPFSNKKDTENKNEKYVWLKWKIKPGEDVTLGGMSKQFFNKTEDKKHRKTVYHFYAIKDLGKSWYLKASGWITPWKPKYKKRGYQIGLGIGRRY